MGFRKITLAETYHVVSDEHQARISSRLSKLGKTSVSELTDEERQQVLSENQTPFDS